MSHSIKDSPIKGPYVWIACFCERVLQEKDGALSAIRIVDKVIVEVDPSNSEKAKLGTQATILIALKSGDFRGTGLVSLRATTPSGKVLADSPHIGVTLNGGEHGHNIILATAVPVGEEGTYWFDVLFNDRVLTRMSLTVELSAPSTGTAPGALRQQDPERSKG